MTPSDQFNSRAARKQAWEIEHDRFISGVKTSLDRIFNPRFQLPFGVACCQRMLPSYAAFQRNARWGNFRLLFDLSNVLWRECQEPRLRSEDILSMVREVEKASADSEATYNGAGIREVGIAQSVCSIFHQVLRFIETKDIRLLQLAAQITLEHFENRAYFSIEGEAPGRRYSPEQQIEEDNRRMAAAWKSPALQHELRRQESDLGLLRFLSQTDDEQGLEEFIVGTSSIRRDSFGTLFDESDINAQFSTERVDPQRTGASAFYRAEPPRTKG